MFENLSVPDNESEEPIHYKLDTTYDSSGIPDCTDCMYHYIMANPVDAANTEDVCGFYDNLIEDVKRQAEECIQFVLIQ